MHGAGIRAMGRLMDRVLGTVDPRPARAPEIVREELALIAPHCRWTAGPGRARHCGGTRSRTSPATSRNCRSYLIRVYLHARVAAGDEVLLSRQPGPDRSRLRLHHRGTGPVPGPPARRPLRPRGAPPGPFDGLLVSKAIVDGTASASGKYTVAQRHRLYRDGAAASSDSTAPVPRALTIMGDCGAFTYVNETTRPTRVDEVIDFYEAAGSTSASPSTTSILGYDPTVDHGDPRAAEWVRRQDITLELAAEFRRAAARAGSASRRSASPRAGARPPTPLRSRTAADRLPADRPGRHGAAQDRRDPRLPAGGRRRPRPRTPTAPAGHHPLRQRPTSPPRGDQLRHHVAVPPVVQGRPRQLLRPRRHLHRPPGPPGRRQPKLKARIRPGEIDQGHGDGAGAALPPPAAALRRREVDAEPVVDAWRATGRCGTASRPHGRRLPGLLADRPWQACPCGICEASASRSPSSGARSATSAAGSTTCTCSDSASSANWKGRHHERPPVRRGGRCPDPAATSSACLPWRSARPERDAVQLRHRRQAAAAVHHRVPDPPR